MTVTGDILTPRGEGGGATLDPGRSNYDGGGGRAGTKLSRIPAEGYLRFARRVESGRAE